MINKKSNGQALSSGFGTTVQGKSRQFDAQLMINGSAIDCDIEYISCYKGSCGSELSVGSVYASYIEGSLKRCATDLNTKELTYNVGLKVDGAFEYLTMGKFTVIEAKESNGSVTFMAVSTLGMKGNLAYSTALTYPTTINSVITELSTALGATITLKGLVGTGTIQKPLTGLVRDALGTIGCLLGGFVTEDNTGNIVISKYNAGETVTIEPYRSIMLPEFLAPYLITGIQINVDDETEYVAGTPVIVQECEWMTQALFNVMENNIVGLQFDLAEVQIALGDPRIEPWDILEVTDLKSSSHDVPCFEIVHTFNGGFETEVTAEVETAEMSDTNVRGALSKVVERLDADVLAASVAATQAKASADAAAEILSDMEDAAEQAGTTLTQIYQDAADASSAASRAETAAGQAQTSAGQALSAATSANASANSALTQLGIVEDVIGTLNWISEHATYKASTDTTVVGGKYYFTRSGTSPNYTYTVVTNPTGNPSTNGYYEIDSIDEAVTNYVSTHLSLTSEGLWVINDSNAYKILLSSTGMKVYDPQGALVSTFGESITFSANRVQTIGNSNCYVTFNPANGGTLTIGGATIQMGNQTLDQVLGTKANTSDLHQTEVSVYPTTVDWSAGTATLAVTLRVDGTVTTPTSYRWTKNTSTTSLGTGSTLTIDGTTNTLNDVYNCTVTW